MEWQRSFREGSFSDILELIGQTLAVLTVAGVRVSGQSRFRRLERHFKEVVNTLSGEGSLTEVDLTSMAEGYCDLQQLSTIVQSQITMGHTRLLGEVVKGTTFPWEETLTRPRDIQFQLYMTAILGKVGFPVEVAEPDIQFIFGGRRYGVAVKRIQRVERLEERLDEGTKQLKRSGLPRPAG